MARRGTRLAELEHRCAHSPVLENDAQLAATQPALLGLPHVDVLVGAGVVLQAAGAGGDGQFDLVFSALAVHHLDTAGMEDLFRRVAGVLSPGGRFVLGDVVVPRDPSDVVTPSGE